MYRRRQFRQFVVRICMLYILLRREMMDEMMNASNKEVTQGLSQVPLSSPRCRFRLQVRPPRVDFAKTTISLTCPALQVLDIRLFQLLSSFGRRKMAWMSSGRTNEELIKNMRDNGLIHSDRVAAVRSVCAMSVQFRR